jgi:hypothetical protein
VATDDLDKKYFDEAMKYLDEQPQEIPTRKTIKAMESKKLFSAESATEMIRDALGDPNWQPNSNKEATDKIFRFDGTNQNTLDAWIRVDTPENENIRISVEDSFGSYTWHRKKSNDNVRGRIEDGKGFGFFFVRYAYFDEFKYEDESHVTNDNLNYSSFLATVPFKSIINFNNIKNDKGIMKKLNPSNSILLAINTNTEIISATYTKKEEYINVYLENRIEKLSEKQDFLYKEWLREKVEKGLAKKLRSMLINGYEQFSDFLFTLKNK